VENPEGQKQKMKQAKKEEQEKKKRTGISEMVC